MPHMRITFNIFLFKVLQEVQIKKKNKIIKNQITELNELLLILATYALWHSIMVLPITVILKFDHVQ